jgi:two-component system, cell cycle sensor histidine kinase and response regulator CckA
MGNHSGCWPGFGWREGYVGPVLVRPPAESLTGRTLQGEDFVVGDLGTDTRFTAVDFVREHGVVSAISVAVKGKANNVFGVLGAYTSRRRVLGEDDLRFMESLANVLGAAIERKRAEAEVQKYQSQMQHLQRLESVGQVAAGLAHDYNNVLTVIHGHVTLALGRSKLPPDLATSLKLVLEAVERAANLTRQMLSFSRKQSLRPQSVDLNAVMTNMAKLLDRVLGRNIQLKLEPMPDLPAIQADPGMLDQVVMNLAVNASDAMPKGGSLLLGTAVLTVDPARAQRHPEARPGTFVCLNVTDSGCGMDEPTLRRIFDPFFTTKEPGKGTGLGLSTVYGIVKQHQGWIEVESEPGRGTAFHLFFPFLSGALATPDVPAKSAAPASRGETVLLVEDEPILRDLARLLLEGLGYRVLEAGSGQEALEVWIQHQQTIDVLLTDLVMPDGLTGFELAERVERERPGVKVIFTSGYSADEVSNKFPVQRGFHFIQKPYHADSLGRALRVCLDDQQAPALSPPPPG